MVTDLTYGRASFRFATGRAWKAFRKPGSVGDSTYSRRRLNHIFVLHHRMVTISTFRQRFDNVLLFRSLEITSGMQENVGDLQ